MRLITVKHAAELANIPHPTAYMHLAEWGHKGIAIKIGGRYRIKEDRFCREVLHQNTDDITLPGLLQRIEEHGACVTLLVVDGEYIAEITHRCGFTSTVVSDCPEDLPAQINSVFLTGSVDK